MHAFTIKDLTLFADQLGMKLDTEEDLHKLADKQIEALKKFADDVSKKDRMGLWQELNQFGSDSWECFNAHVVKAFTDSADDISQAVSSGDARAICKSILGAALNIFSGFKDFFTEMADRYPKVAEFVSAAVKTAVVFSIMNFAPYLTPLATTLINLVPDGKKEETKKEVEQDLQKIDSAVSDMISKDRNLDDALEVAKKSAVVLAKSVDVLPVEQREAISAQDLLSLKLKSSQLDVLGKTMSEPMANFLQKVCVLRSEVPDVLGAVKVFCESGKEEVMSVINQYAIHGVGTEEQKKQIREMFIGFVDDSVQKMKESLDNSQMCVFDQVAGMAKFSEELQKSSKALDTKIRELGINASDVDGLSLITQDFFVQKCQKPISIAKSVVDSARGLKSDDMDQIFGLTRANSMQINRSDQSTQISRGF